MTNRRKIVVIMGFAAALMCVGLEPAVAGLRECFRDGYLGSVA